MKAIAVLALAVCPLIAVERTARTDRNFTVGGSPKLIIDNIWGGIDVSAAEGNRIEVHVDERWEADTQALLDKAGQEVKLDISQSGDTVRLYVDGPFRCQGGVSFRGDPGYEAHFNYRVRVPRNTAVELRTINEGDIRVQGIGDFDISHVNGRIDALDVSGSGRMHTVNGPVKVTFRENPRGATSFKTINGELTTTMRPGFSADLQMKTMNGDAFSDFEYSYLPLVPITERKGTRFAFRGGATRLRVGSGGPEMKFETLNGTIRILRGQ